MRHVGVVLLRHVHPVGVLPVGGVALERAGLDLGRVLLRDLGRLGVGALLGEGEPGQPDAAGAYNGQRQQYRRDDFELRW